MDTFPNPFDEILTWARTNRPDTLEHLEPLFTRIQRAGAYQRDDLDDAMGLVISIAFASGREYGERYTAERWQKADVRERCATDAARSRASARATGCELDLVESRTRGPDSRSR